MHLKLARANCRVPGTFPGEEAGKRCAPFQPSLQRVDLEASCVENRRVVRTERKFNPDDVICRIRT
jgi:hypothetical protein